MAGDINEFDNGFTPEEMAELEEKETTANPDNGKADETATATPPEKTNDEEEEGSEPSKTTPKSDEDEDKLPFHKHPRWIAQRKREEALEAELQEQREWRDKMEERLNNRGNEEEEELPPIPDWFIQAYGEDEELWALHLENEERLEQEREERILARIEAKREEASTREQQDLQWVEDQLTAVRDNLAEGEPDFEDNELLKVLTDFRPSDEDGNLDFRAAYNILQKMKAAGTAPAPKPKNGSTKDKKNLAAHVNQSASETDEDFVASNETFANGDKPW